jgi:hypothetical protein
MNKLATRYGFGGHFRYVKNENPSNDLPYHNMCTVIELSNCNIHN